MIDNTMSSAGPSDDVRGRRRTRDSDDDDDAEDGSVPPPGSSKKRRRSRKGLDKKFECPHEGCGRSYSRAEHLYRHQLNRKPFVRSCSSSDRADNPKQIYHCDFPDCLRSFVRQDLCARHKERHTARGSQLLRRDNFSHHPNPIVMEVQKAKLSAAAAAASAQGGYQSNGSPNTTPRVGASSPSLDPKMSKSDPSDQKMDSKMSDDGFRTPESSQSDAKPRSGFQAANQTQSQYTAQRSNTDPFRPSSVTSNPAFANSFQNYSRPLGQSQTTPQATATFQSLQNMGPLSSLPPPTFPVTARDGPVNLTDAPDSRMGASSDTAMMDALPPSLVMPVFGSHGYERSPFAMADDFAAWLFNESAFGTNSSPIAYPGAPIQHSTGVFGFQPTYYPTDPVSAGFAPQPVPHPMAVNNLIDTNMQQMALSGDRQRELIELIESRFHDSEAPVRGQEEFLHDGDRDDNRHILSLEMLHTYIASYWEHFHPQMPILHKPTFEANKCPQLLLIAIIALGSSCLEKRHGLALTQNCSDFSNFLAWHLRWELFMARDSRPPAKLWVFQALLLLEIFEKMYSTRPLHERAHIHHATTLTLMRRGSSLIGRSAVESPPPGSQGTSRHGSVNGSTSTNYNYSNDEWWNQWIHSEATRRVAFAAFVMDSIHATMFGHSAVMVAHEMRLALPCDEALWSATSSGEIGRVEASLNQHGIKPTMFLDGLKKTLNNQAVRTNSFGRTILMAGLLSVSWHMNQRDLQVSSLGVSQALGGRDRWRGALTRAFDFWKVDLDESIAKAHEGPPAPGFTQANRPDDENIFENRTVLHHLAHMAMHVDIVDCQIFAGATRLLGRAITQQDYNGAQRRMKEGWAPTARARDATFFALRFLGQVLMPDEHGSPHQRPTSQVGRDGNGQYSARDDFLLNRPWVLYFATLIVWSYGYALDGPITPLYALQDYGQVVKDMRGFLNRVGKVRAPDDLAHVTNRNACLGLLVLMRDTFAKTRWELLHEASNRLQKCIEKLSGGQAVQLPPAT
jgi:hypothetical protein